MDDVLRRYQTHPVNQNRQKHGEYHTLFPYIKKYPDKFIKYTRMLPSTFDYILSKIEGQLKKNWCNLHYQPILPEERLVITIRFLSNGLTYNALAFSFRMGESTVCTIVTEVMTVLWNVLQPIHLIVPNEGQLKKIANDFFERWNFPHCLGAIDCRHIRIKKPPFSKSLFFNWKQFYSIKLQAVVDARYKFIFIEVGDYGSTHDSTTFFYSELFEALKSGVLKFPEDDELPGSSIILPYCFIGDGAYMLMQNLMKPYRGKYLLRPMQIFNKRCSRARIVSECAFGHLVQMWRIFFTTIQQKPETAALITKVCCLLRNIIIDMEGVPNFAESQEEILAIGNVLISDADRDKEFVVGYGTEVRDEFTKYFIQHPLE